MPQYFNIISGLFQLIHHLLDQYVFHAYSQLAEALHYPLALCITLYIVLLGYSISQGWVTLSMSHLIKTAMKIGLIYTFSMNWNFFSHMVIEFIEEGANQLGGVLLHPNENFNFFNPNSGIDDALQDALVHISKIGYWLWRRGSLSSISPYFEAIVIWAAGITLILLATVQLLISNIMLSILFVLSPLFIIFTLFQSTHSLFDKWAGYIVSYALLMIFISVLLAFVLNMVQWVSNGIQEDNLMSTLLIGTFIPIVSVCFVGIALIKRVTQMAHNIGLNFSTLVASQQWSILLSKQLNLKIEQQLQNDAIDNASPEQMYDGLHAQLRRGH